MWNETYTLPVHVKEHQALTAIMYDSVRAPLSLSPGQFAAQDPSFTIAMSVADKDKQMRGESSCADLTAHQRDAGPLSPTCKLRCPVVQAMLLCMHANATGHHERASSDQVP